MMIPMVVCVTLSACATVPQDPVTTTVPLATVPVQPAPTAPARITPVALGELRGSEGLVFPDIDVPSAIAGVEGYAADCLAGRGLSRMDEPHGFALMDGGSEPFLRVTVATVSQSSALGLGGTGLTPAMKEAIAATVQGRPYCAP